MRDALNQLAAKWGANPMLIQAAGGNFSWKDGDTLWVKASGTWLANALKQDVFVAVDLSGVRQCIDEGGENYADFKRDASPLRPSIETALHALLPQKIVAHVHAVDALVHAVLKNGEAILKQKLAGLEWLWVPYYKPGASLARHIGNALQSKSTPPQVLVLANHGLIVCGDSVEAIEELMFHVSQRLHIEPRRVASVDDGLAQALSFAGFHHVPQVKSLAIDSVSLALARDRWVMYPDHVVFLGQQARILDAAAIDADAIATIAIQVGERPCLIVAGQGAWLADAAPAAAESMLICYANVCARITAVDDAVPLSPADIGALMNWEAEAYRRNLKY